VAAPIHLPCADKNLVNATDNLLAKTGVIGKEEIKGKNLTDSVKGRFYGPNAISPGDKADKQFAKLKKEVTTSNEYKNASQYDKGRMLNRLESDISAVEWHKSGKSDTKLTKKQDAMNTGAFFAETYTKLDDKSSTKTTKSTSTTTKDLPKGMNGHDIATLKRFDDMEEDKREKLFYKEPKAEYQLAVAKYERDKKLGNLTTTENIRRQQEVEKAKVGIAYDKEVRDLYGLSKSQLYGFLSGDNDGKALADKVINTVMH